MKGRLTFTVEDAIGFSRAHQRARIETALTRAREQVALEERRDTCSCGARRAAHLDGGACGVFRPIER
jgi:hypothetical protein